MLAPSPRRSRRYPVGEGLAAHTHARTRPPAELRRLSISAKERSDDRAPAAPDQQRRHAPTQSARNDPVNEKGGAYWGEQAPPQQRLIGGNRTALRVKLSFDYGSV